MKKKLPLIAAAALLIIASAVMLAGCQNYQALYESDSKIASTNSNYAETGAVSNLTSAQYSLTAKKFSGIKTIKTLSLADNPTINVTLTIASGQFKVVLTQGNNVYLVTDATCTAPVPMTLAAGSYALKIVGVSAQVSLVITF